MPRGPESESSRREGHPPSGEGAEFVYALRSGDEAAFVVLLDRYSAGMLRVASLYVSKAVAEEVVQEAWLGIFKGIHKFEARSSLKTWIFRILVNRAKARLKREARSIPFSAHWDPATAPADPSVSPDRFQDANHPQWPHHWVAPPRSWGESPEDRLLSKETRGYIQRAIDALPPSQREVISLRDIEGWEPEEVCQALGITGVNQRVLLHRARAKVRQALEQYFEGV